jgi:hypothetical protein
VKQNGVDHHHNDEAEHQFPERHKISPPRWVGEKARNDGKGFHQANKVSWFWG